MLSFHLIINQLIRCQSGKPNFGYIYGVGLFGTASIYTLLNLMSPHGIDAYRTASVLGYCLLPMVGLGAISVMVALEYVARAPFLRFGMTLICGSQRHHRVPALNYINTLVYICRFWDLRRRPSHVRPASPCSIPCWPALWVFRSPQCI